jgi:hypothetical protein
MGFLGNLLKKIRGEAPTELILVPSVPVSGMSGIGDPIVVDECYIELYVESLRLERARRFATKFDGAVYSFVSLSRDGQERSELAAVSKPNKLAELDKKSLGNVITVSKQMMGAVPWRGGTIGLEVGLFSIKRGNVLTPVLDYVDKVSSTAGISFVGAVKPFLPLIKDGVDLLAGQQQDTEIEVALDTDMALTMTCVLAMIDAPKGSLDPSKVTLDPNDRRLLLSGKPLDKGYFVLSIRKTEQKTDFGEIPELKEKYAAIQAAIRANKQTEAEDALTAFRLATIVSPDLITKDAAALVEKARKKLEAAFVRGPISRSTRGASIEALSEIGLYPRN